jgi:hypothetical protein
MQKKETEKEKAKASPLLSPPTQSIPHLNSSKKRQFAAQPALSITHTDHSYNGQGQGQARPMRAKQSKEKNRKEALKFWYYTCCSA